MICHRGSSNGYGPQEGYFKTSVFENELKREAVMLLSLADNIQ